MIRQQEGQSGTVEVKRLEIAGLAGLVVRRKILLVYGVKKGEVKYFYKKIYFFS